jgi:hypothetical protein
VETNASIQESIKKNGNALPLNSEDYWSYLKFSDTHSLAVSTVANYQPIIDLKIIENQPCLDREKEEQADSHY